MKMGTREALQLALNNLTESHYERTPEMAEAIQVIETMLAQGGCGEITPGEQPLTDVVDMVMFA